MSFQPNGAKEVAEHSLNHRNDLAELESKEVPVTSKGSK